LSSADVKSTMTTKKIDAMISRKDSRPRHVAARLEKAGLSFARQTRMSLGATPWTHSIRSGPASSAGDHAKIFVRCYLVRVSLQYSHDETTHCCLSHLNLLRCRDTRRNARNAGSANSNAQSIALATAG
jgi:hypothetical protein